MNKAATTILVNTCDSYIDVFELLMFSLNEYWFDRPFDITVNAELRNYSDYGVMTHNSVRVKMSWGERLLNALKEIESEYILMLYDDFILESKVNNDIVYKCIELLESEVNAAVVYLVNTSLPTFSNSGDFLEVKNNCDYRLNSFPAIWRKSDLISMTGIYDSPWAWEFFGSHRRAVNKKKFYTLNPKIGNIYSFKHEMGGAIYRGRWVKEVVESKAIKYEWNIDFSVRGFADIEQPIKRSLLWKMNFLMLGFRILGFRVLKLVAYTFLFKKDK